MGGASVLIPAPYSGISTRTAHTRRRPPSSEPGTDYYMPIGTPLRAPMRATVVDVGGGIVPATGRYVTIDDGTRWYRFLHMKEQHVRRGQVLEQGEVFGLSGASGYGSEFFGASSMANFPWANTGGPHVHVTAFRGRGYTFGNAGTIDFHALTGGAVAGGNATPTPTPSGDELMTDAQYEAMMWELSCLREIKMYHLVEEDGSGGWVWVGPSGKAWIVPNPQYAVLADAQKLSQVRPIRSMSRNEFGFTVGQLLPNTHLTAAEIDDLTDDEKSLVGIAKLAPETVAEIVAGIRDNTLPVVLNESQLAAVAAAAAEGAKQGGEDGAKAAIVGLSFVVSTGA